MFEVKITQLCLTLQPHGLYSPWNSPGQDTRGVDLPFNLPNPGVKLGSPALQEDSLITELSGKPNMFEHV